MKPLEKLERVSGKPGPGFVSNAFNQLAEKVDEIIDRVNEISAIVEPKIIATTVTSYDEFGLKGDIKKVGTTPIKKFKSEDIELREMWIPSFGQEQKMSATLTIHFKTKDEAQAALELLLNL